MELANIQSLVKAPKGQTNKFGNYKYRSCEDIVESVKPIINPLGYALILSDEIVEVGGRIYIRATATITNGTITYLATAYAREDDSKKGMDASQLTGATSSYARKYALNGLFAIDDTKDADATNTHEDTRIVLTPTHANWEKVKTAVASGHTFDEIEKKYRISPENKTLLC